MSGDVMGQEKGRSKKGGGAGRGGVRGYHGVGLVDVMGRSGAYGADGPGAGDVMGRV